VKREWINSLRSFLNSWPSTLSSDWPKAHLEKQPHDAVAGIDLLSDLLGYALARGDWLAVAEVFAPEGWQRHLKEDHPC